MIIDLTITNFRSIREKQTFSLYAESTSTHLDNNISYPDNGQIGVLRTAGIYGANASGKSNILLSLKALRYIICYSGDLKDGDDIPCYEPYLLSESSKDAPVEFEIEFFSKDNLRYIYNVSFNKSKIISESLGFYPSRTKASLFNREDGDNWETIGFGGHYKGGKKKFAFFKNNSYLSKAGNSADAPDLVRSIYNDFRLDLLHLGANEEISMTDWKDSPEIVSDMASILSNIDTGISSIDFKEQDVSNINLPKNFPDSLKKKILADEKKVPVFLHKGDGETIEEFTVRMESAGTMKLFNMLPMLIDAFDDGGVLVLDELDNSFHPHVAELIIKLFNDPKVNRKNAQLIFSTHNMNLMSPELLRRDQIWLTEKKKGETTLTSLEEFDKETVKIDSPFNKWYEDGRFGAIPEINIAAISETLSKRSL